MGSQVLAKLYNFGIYRKRGKRCILQLDFPCRLLLVIQKGRIKKTQNFDSLHHFDSEDGLCISLKFGHTEIDFEADNAEDKYAICCLLTYILQMVHGGDDESFGSVPDVSTLNREQIGRSHVIKEGILEKKGNNTFTSWNKRKIRLVPGQFSYYKPGEELALNIVQLWQDSWDVKKLAQNGLTVRVRDKIYSFRVPSEYKGQHVVEIVRNEWIVAFEQAFSDATLNIKMSQPSPDVSISNAPEHIYDSTADMAELFSMTSAHDTMQLPVASHPAGEITAHVTVHLNYVDKAVSLQRAAMDDWSSEQMSFTQDKRCMQTEPPCDQGPPSGARDPFAGSAAALREKLEKQGGKSSSVKAYRAQADFNQQQNQTRSVAHAVLKTCLSEDSGLLLKQQSKLNDDDRKFLHSVVGERSLAGKEKNRQVQGVQSTASSYTPSEVGKKRMMIMPPPPPPPPPLPPADQPGNAPGGPPLPPMRPPPAPLVSNGDETGWVSNCRLRQVHWVKVSSNQIAASMWRNARDVTDRLDLTELEDQFSIQEKKTSDVKPKLHQDKGMLIDTKRAQNLGILFCGLRPENVFKLTQALNSTTELDSFPADKMAAFKRYQPTSEDREMYKACHRQDSLHHADQFMLELCEIPNLGLRLDLALTLWEFPDHYTSLQEEVDDLLNGCEEILTSTGLTLVLEYLLAMGNYMNSLWNAKQRVHGFQLSSIDKILSVKGRDPQVTLCTYLVKQIQNSQPNLMNWSKFMGHVSKCAGYSVKAVGAEIDVLKNDLLKIKKLLKTLRNSSCDDKMDRKFQADVQSFIVEYDHRLELLNVKYATVMDKYQQLMVRFGESSSKSTESLFSYVGLLVEKFQQAAEALRL